MVMSPYEWKILEWDEKKHKKANKQTNSYVINLGERVSLLSNELVNTEPYM